MKKAIFIPRLVSIEKLSPVIDLCQANWPEHSITVLTSSNRVHELEQDGRIATIIPLDPGLNGYTQVYTDSVAYEAIVLPISNQNGIGYANAFRAFSKIQTEQFYLSPHCQSLLNLTVQNFHNSYQTEEKLETLLMPFAHLMARYMLKKLQ